MVSTPHQHGPTREELLEVYHGLDKEMHPHHLLPLESRLPDELKVGQRDQYRIIMTMILSERISDYKLSKALGRLFHKYPDFKSLQCLSKQQIIDKILAAKDQGGCGFGGYGKPNGGGNDDRLWSLLDHYFNVWGMKITKPHIRGLENSKSAPGFGPKFVRTLLAYCFGDNNVIPLDKPALNALRDPLFPAYSSFSDDKIRRDIEEKLGSVSGISLIDFHEMLRFVEQYTGKSKKTQDDIIIGWNAWRLICSKKRECTTEHWIRDNLVKDDSIAKRLWNFINTVK